MDNIKLFTALSIVVGFVVFLISLFIVGAFAPPVVNSAFVGLSIVCFIVFFQIAASAVFVWFVYPYFNKK